MRGPRGVTKWSWRAAGRRAPASAGRCKEMDASRAPARACRSEAWAGTYGAAPGIGPEAAANAKLNVLWGNNATVTNLHVVRNVRAAKKTTRKPKATKNR